MSGTATAPAPAGDPTARLLLEREARSLTLLVTVVLVGFVVLAAQFVVAAPIVTRERIHAPVIIAYFASSILLSLALLALLWRRQWVRAVGIVVALFAATFAAVSGVVIWRSLAIDVPVAILAKLPIASVGLAVIASMALTLRPLHVVIAGTGVAATLLGFFAVASGDPRTTMATYSIEPYLGPSISRTRLLFELVFVATATVAGAFATQIARNTVRQAAELQRSTDQLSRYFSPDIAAGIRDGGDAFLEPGGHEQDVVVLFSDIAGFTRTCADLTPAQSVALLSEYQEHMVAEIFEAGGTLDKFIGDGIMATFGTPVAAPDAADRAVRAAQGMMAALVRLNARRTARGEPPLAHRIGIHAGPAVVGSMGTSQRREFSVIGDTVNVANRIETACKKTGRPVMISAAVLRQLRQPVRTEALGPVNLDGQPQPIELYALV
jgi:adenylate cyclase